MTVKMLQIELASQLSTDLMLVWKMSIATAVDRAELLAIY
jgi:hypothetical protein